MDARKTRISKVGVNVYWQGHNLSEIKERFVFIDSNGTLANADGEDYETRLGKNSAIPTRIEDLLVCHGCGEQFEGISYLAQELLPHMHGNDAVVIVSPFGETVYTREEILKLKACFKQALIDHVNRRGHENLIKYT